MADLVPIDDAIAEFQIGRATIFRYLATGELKRYPRRMDRKTYVDRLASKQLLGWEQVATRWLEKAMLRWRPGTYAATEANVRRFIIPALGQKLAADLTPADVDDLLAFAATPQPGGRGLAPSSRQHLRRQFGTLLRW